MAKNLDGDSFVVEGDAQSILKMLQGVLVAKSNLAVIDHQRYKLLSIMLVCFFLLFLLLSFLETVIG